MKFKILIVIFVICMIFALGGCGDTNGIIVPPPPPNPDPDNPNPDPDNPNPDPVDPNNGFDLVPNDAKISINTLYSELNAKKWTIIDVRSYSDWMIKSVIEARCIPLNFLDSRSKEIPQDKPVVLVAGKGQDALTAWQLLIDKGYDRNLVKILDGGHPAWEKAGYPTSEHEDWGC